MIGEKILAIKKKPSPFKNDILNFSAEDLNNIYI